MLAECAQVRIAKTLATGKLRQLWYLPAYKHEYVHFTSFTGRLSSSSQSFTCNDLHCESKARLKSMA